MGRNPFNTSKALRVKARDRRPSVRTRLFKARCPVCGHLITPGFFEREHRDCRAAVPLVYSPSDKDKPSEAKP